MPLKPGSSKETVSQNISEFHTGPTYAHTAAKFGKARANAQAVAVAMNTARKYRADGGEVSNDQPDKEAAISIRPVQESDPFEIAAARTRQSVRPELGRPEGGTSKVLSEYLPHTYKGFTDVIDTAAQYRPDMPEEERHALVGEMAPQTFGVAMGTAGAPLIGATSGAATLGAGIYPKNLPKVLDVISENHANDFLVKGGKAEKTAKATMQAIDETSPEKLAEAIHAKNLDYQQLDNVFSYIPEEKHNDILGHLIDIENGVNQELGQSLAAGQPLASKATKSNFGNVGEPINFPEMVPLEGTQAGSNAGGQYVGPATGKKYYIKDEPVPGHAQNEMLAAKLGGLAGLNTFKYRPVMGGGKVATEFTPLEKNNANLLTSSQRKKAQEDFATHAWLANWDAVGLGGDNLGWLNGKPIAVDLGGALEFRAQGGAKGANFGNKVGEIDTLRDPSMNPDSAALYGHMTEKEMADSARKVVSIPDKKIVSAILDHNGDMELASKMLARKDDLAERFGIKSADPDYVHKYKSDLTRKPDYTHEKGYEPYEGPYKIAEDIKQAYNPEEAFKPPLDPAKFDEEYDKWLMANNKKYPSHDVDSPHQGGIYEPTTEESNALHQAFDDWAASQDAKGHPPAEPDMPNGDPTAWEPTGGDLESMGFLEAKADALLEQYGGYGTSNLDKYLKPIKDWTRYRMLDIKHPDYVKNLDKFVDPDKMPRRGSGRAHIEWGSNDPKELEKKGVNTHMQIWKRGDIHDPHPEDPLYPKEIGDPEVTKKYSSERGLFFGTKSVAEGYKHYGPMGGAYVLQKPKNPMEIDYYNAFGTHDYGGEMGQAIMAARAKGADVLFVNRVNDNAKNDAHRIHTQVVVLDTSLLRSPKAKFANPKLRDPFAAIAGTLGTGAAAYGLTGQQTPEGMKRGGIVLDRAMREAKKYASGGPLDESNLGKISTHVPHMSGMLHSSIPGRTDKLPINVKAGSYIIPADIPSASALGEGNTMAGTKVLDHMIGSHLAKRVPHASGQIKLPGMKKKLKVATIRATGKMFADGGETTHVPIIAAGGEYVVSPEAVQAIGDGDMDKGHNTLDDFVKRIRKHNIKTLRGLKPPRVD